MNNGNFIKGVNIIARYVEDEDYNLCARDEIIFFASEGIVTDERDINKLKELGWHIEEDSWTCYV